MKSIYTFIVAALIVVPTSLASAMTYEEIVAKIQYLENQISKLQATNEEQSSETNTQPELETGAEPKIVASQEHLTIYADGTEIFSSSESVTVSEAEMTCNEYAFDIAYMWQTVRCVHNDDTIYENIFVAG